MNFSCSFNIENVLGVGPVLGFFKEGVGGV